MSELKMPADLSADARRAVRLIRWFFIRELEKVRRARTAGATYVPPPEADNPASGYCAWYVIYKQYTPEVNPLWGIREELEHKLVINKDADPWNTLKVRHIQEYQEYGIRASTDCRIEAESAIYSVVERLPVVKLSFGFTEDKLALDMIGHQAAVDPVIKLVFCVVKGIPVDKELKFSAMARWAYCPHIYTGMPRDIIEKYELKNLFGVPDDFAATERVGIDGLLRSLRVIAS